MKRTLIAFLLVSLVLSACVPSSRPMPTQPATSTPAPTVTQASPTASGVADLTRGSVSDLVAILTSEQASFGEVLQAVQEILARGGIATGDLQNTFVRPYAPASSLMVTPREVLQLAQEARSGPSVWRTDLAELGQHLSDLGWLTEAGRTPGEQLIRLLVAWGAEAARDPQNPENFPPLFLLAMAQYRAPGVDFSVGPVSPEQVRFGLLEMLLLVAAFDRLIPVQRSGGADLSGARLASLLPAGDGMGMAQISPCKPFQDSLFGRLAYSDIGNFWLQWAAGKGIEKGLNAAGISEWGQDKIGKAMFALGMWARVMRSALMAAYVGIQVTLEGDQSVHKPLEGEQLLKAFHARAGISPQDWQAYQEQFGKGFHNALRECLSWLGVASYTLDDLRGEMESWAIEWELTAGSPEHARWSPDQQVVPGQVHLGLWRTPLARPSADSTVGESRFVVEVRNEKQGDHPGLSLEGTVQACAFLDVAQAPKFSTFAQAAFGGLPGVTDSVVGLLTGMMEKLAKPKRCQDLQVTYHTNCIMALWYIQQGAMKPDQAALDKLRKCLTFELKFESQVEMWGGSYTGAAESIVRLQFDPSNSTIKGQGPLNLKAHLEIAGPEMGKCSTHTTTTPGTFEVSRLEFVFLRRIQTDEVVVQDLKLVYFPPYVTESNIAACPENITYTFPSGQWAGGYHIAHLDELSEAEGGLVATGWTILGGEEYARREWHLTTDAVGPTTESGRFILYHRPEE
jgi:hypothetical protein